MSQTLTALPPINKNYAVTNNTGVDIVVLDASTDAGAVTAEQLYEQSLKILSTTDGQQIIKSGATGTVVLNDTHKDSSGADVYSKVYNLIIAKADNLYPIQAEGVMLTFSSQSYAPLTIGADAFKNMQLAENFQQTIMAYPTSNLSKDYQTAVNGATDNSGSATAIDTAVDKFFSSTKQYQAVTLNMVVALSTYYSQFPFVWASYKSTKTYYLYSSDGTTVKDCGSVQINVPATASASTDKTLPGFTLTYTDSSSNSKKLYYSTGQFVDDPEADMPGICLQGLFTLKSQLTKKDADNTVIAVLSGTVNGDKVLGYDEKQSKDDQGNWSGLYTLLHPKDAMGWIQLFMTFMGVVMGIDFIVKALKGEKDGMKEKSAENDGKDPSSSDIEEIKSQMEEMKTEMRTNNQDMLDKMNDNLKVTDDLNKSVDDLQTQVQDRLNEDHRSLLDDSMNSQGDLLEQVAEYSVDQKVEDIGDALETNMTKLDGATTEELGDVLPDIKTNVSQITSDLKVEVDKVSSQVSDEVKNSMDDAKQELDDAGDMSDNIDDSSEDAENGDVPDDMEFEPVEF